MRLGIPKAGSAGAVACLLALAVQASSAVPGFVAVLSPISGSPHARRSYLSPPRGIASSRDEPRLSPGPGEEYDHGLFDEDSSPMLRGGNEGASSEVGHQATSYVRHKATEDSSTDSVVENILTLSKLRATLEESIEDVEQMIGVHTNSSDAGAAAGASHIKTGSEARLESLSARLLAQFDDVKLHLRSLGIAACADDPSLATYAERIGLSCNKTDHAVSATALKLGSEHNESNHTFENRTTSSPFVSQGELISAVSCASTNNNRRQEKKTLLARIAELEKRLMEVSARVAAMKLYAVHNEANHSFAGDGTFLNPSTSKEDRIEGRSATKQSKQEEVLEKLVNGNQRRIDELEERLTEVEVRAASIAMNAATNASLVPSASAYFLSTLASGFEEAGIKSMEFNGEDLAILRFIFSGMRAGETGMNLVELPNRHGIGVIKQLIDLSLKLQMLWLAQEVARRALESSDAAMLLDLLLVAEDPAQHDREGALMWKELSNRTVQRLACMVEEASKVEAFSRLPLELVQRILVLVKDVAWPEWCRLDVSAHGAGSVSSPPTKEGFFLNVTKHADGHASAYVYVSDDPAAPVNISGGAFVGIDFEIQAMYQFQLFDRDISRVIPSGHGRGWSRLQPKKSGLFTPFANGDRCVFRFRARRSKLHFQCQILLECIKAKLPPEAQEEHLIVSAFELLRGQKALEDLREMLVEYMAVAFAWDVGREALGQLSLCDMEAVIAHPRLCTPSDGGEFFVLKAALDWARSSERLVPSVGAVVRVRNDSVHEQWRGAECTIVEKIRFQREDYSASCLWKIETTSFPSGEPLCVEVKDLLCPGHIGMEQLLQHVRFPFIKLEQIKTLLSQEERAVAYDSPAFFRGMTEAVEVQTGKRRAKELGERARKRDVSPSVIPRLDSKLMTKALLLSP